MPIKTDILAWEAPRPDYWAGKRGGRPMPKSAPKIRRGDRGPMEQKLTTAKAFLRHEDAVAYAKLFKSHAQIRTYMRWDDDLEVNVKYFLVEPNRGKLKIVKSTKIIVLS